MLDLPHPALRLGGAAQVVEPLPEHHIADVALAVVLEALVVGGGEVQVVDDFRADGAVPPAHHGNVAGSGFQGRPGVLHGEGAHADNDHPAVPPVDAGRLVADAVDQRPTELTLVLPGDPARRADPVVDRQDHPPAGQAGALPVAADRGPVGPVLLFDPLDAGLGEKIGGDPLGQAVNVLQDLGRGRVIAVGPHRRFPQAVGRLGSVHFRGGVGILRPDAADAVAFFGQADRKPLFLELIGGIQAGDPGPHDEHVDPIRKPGLVAKAEPGLVEDEFRPGVAFDRGAQARGVLAGHQNDLHLRIGGERRRASQREDGVGIAGRAHLSQAPRALRR